MAEIQEKHGLQVSVGPEAAAYVLEVTYESTGELSAKIDPAVTVSVEGKIVASLVFPDQPGSFRFTEDLTAHIPVGGAPVVEIKTYLYNFAINGARVRTEAEVKLRFGRRQLMSAKYTCRVPRRTVTDELLIEDPR